MDNIYCIGEILVDMVCTDNLGLRDGVIFQKKAGGAPFNVACAIKKLGGNSIFLGKIGKDDFGGFLSDTLDYYKVDRRRCTYGGHTTIVFVGIDSQGERSFNFVRGSDREYQLKNEDMKRIFEKNSIIHFGGATAFLGGELEQSYFKALAYAKSHHLYISFDPNYRDTLIPKSERIRFKEKCLKYIEVSDLAKFSEEEAILLSRKETVEAAADYFHAVGAKVIAITLGKKGTLLSVNNNKRIVPTIAVQQVDSTGAGDAFIGAVLKQLSVLENKAINLESWVEIITYSNIVGAITCTDYGAIEPIPIAEQVQDIIMKQKKKHKGSSTL